MIVNAKIAAFAAMLCMGMMAAGPAGAEDKAAAELQRVANSQLDVAFAVPGLDLSRFKAVMLEPLGVNYRRGTGKMYRLGRRDLQQLQERATKAIETSLAGDGRYTLVTQPGPGVLTVRASLEDVWLAAPAEQPGRSRTFSEYAITMVLQAELIDSETDEVLAIVADRQGDRVNARPRQVTNVDTWAQIDKALKFWAASLRQSMDNARGK